jgi:hypothetical protein
MPGKFFTSPLFRVSVRYGAIAGVLCIGFVVSLFYMGKHPFLINPFADFRVPVFAVLLFFCLKEVRDFYLGGVLYFWQAMGGCFFFLLTTAAIAAAGIVAFGSWQSAFLTDYITEFTRQIQNLPPETVDRIGKSVVDQNLKALPATTLGNLATLYAWQSMVIGFFISVIISVILRRQPKLE